jgi:hypothetical protein
MSIKRFLRAGLVIVRNGFIQNAPIACLFKIRCHSQHQPERVIVEIRADIVVAAFGQRLVLMIRTAVRELRRGEVQNPLAGAFGESCA